MTSPAETVIEVFGIRPLAKELDIAPSTVIRWRDRGFIPSKYHVQIIDLSMGKLKPADLVYGR
jgi:hypothetical protein